MSASGEDQRSTTQPSQQLTGPRTTPAPPQPEEPPPLSPAPDRASRDPAETGSGGGRPIGWGLVLIAAGVLWLLSLAGVPIRWELVLPIALVAVGTLLLLGGRWSAHGGLIGLGVVLAVTAFVVATSPAAPSVSAGDRTHRVTDVADLESAYTLGAGTLTLDLRELELPDGTTEVAAGVTMGELVVWVPADVTVEGEGSVVMGEVAAFGRSASDITPRLALAEPGDADRVLVLDLRVTLGRIEVTR